MADLGFEFNPADVPASEYNNEPVPDGKYRLMITDSEVVDNRAQTGKILKLKIEVDGGPYHGRLIWDQLNIVNPSAQAQAISLGTLASIFVACGVARGNDSSALHFKPFIGDVRIDPNPGYEPKNVIKKYKPLLTDGAAASPAAPSRPAGTVAARPAPAAQARPAAAVARPWGAPGGPARPAARPAPAPAMAEEDIPF